MAAPATVRGPAMVPALDTTARGRAITARAPDIMARARAIVLLRHRRGGDTLADSEEPAGLLAAAGGVFGAACS